MIGYLTEGKNEVICEWERWGRGEAGEMTYLATA